MKLSINAESCFEKSILCRVVVAGFLPPSLPPSLLPSYLLFLYFFFMIFANHHIVHIFLYKVPYLKILEWFHCYLLNRALSFETVNEFNPF